MSYNSGYGNQQGGANSSYYNSGGPQNQGQNPYGGPPPLNGQQQGGPPPSYNHGPGFNQGGNHGPGFNQGGNHGQSYQGGPGGAGQDGERGILGAMGGGAAGAFAGHKMGHGILGAIGGAVAGHFAEEKVKDWRDDKKEDEEKRKREEEERRRREDDDRRRREEDDRRRHDNSNRGFSPPRGNYAGNFSGSSRDIGLDGARLRAECRRGDGGYNTSVIDLNRYLSNDNGNFRWVSGGGGGGGSATVTVQQGDTLREIARRFDCDFHEIARRNNIQNEDLIYPGQVLQVPTKGGSGGGNGNFWESARDVRLVDGGKVLEAELRYSGGWNRSRIYLDEHIGNRNGELIHC